MRDLTVEERNEVQGGAAVIFQGPGLEPPRSTQFVVNPRFGGPHPIPPEVRIDPRFGGPHPLPPIRF